MWRSVARSKIPIWVIFGRSSREDVDIFMAILSIFQPTGIFFMAI
jgi:hypothetical protein